MSKGCALSRRDMIFTYLLNNLHHLWNMAAKQAINPKKCEIDENYLRGIYGKAEAGKIRDGR